MYIDSPNFVRRRILGAERVNNSLEPLSHHSKFNEGDLKRSDFGYERMILAKFVADNLNSH